MNKALLVAATLFAAPALAQTAVTTTTSPTATGSVTITTQQEALLGQVISRNPTRRAGHFAVGAAIPAEVELQPLPQEFVTQVPAVQTYRYVTTEAGIALVDPDTRRVVRIIETR